MGVAADRFQRGIFRRKWCARNLFDVLSQRIRGLNWGVFRLGFYSAFLWYEFNFWASIGRFSCFCKFCGFDFDFFAIRVSYNFIRVSCSCFDLLISYISYLSNFYLCGFCICRMCTRVCNPCFFLIFSGLNIEFTLYKKVYV